MKTLLLSFFILAFALSGPGVAGQKPTCAVATFEARGGVRQDEAATLCDWFESELIGLDQYDMVTRSRMEEIVKEQKLSLVCNDATCAIELGNMIAAKYIIFGSISKIGASYVVIATLANVETAKLERTAKYEQEGTIDELLRHGMGVTARRLLGLPEEEETRKVTKRAPVPAPAPEEEPARPSWMKRNWGWLAGGAVVVGGGAALALSGSGGGDSGGDGILGTWVFENDIYKLYADGSAWASFASGRSEGSGSYSLNGTSFSMTLTRPGTTVWYSGTYDGGNTMTLDWRDDHGRSGQVSGTKQ
jgi:hypothetical protein